MPKRPLSLPMTLEHRLVTGVCSETDQRLDVLSGGVLVASDSWAVLNPNDGYITNGESAYPGRFFSRGSCVYENEHAEYVHGRTDHSVRVCIYPTQPPIELPLEIPDGSRVVAMALNHTYIALLRRTESEERVVNILLFNRHTRELEHTHSAMNHGGPLCLRWSDDGRYIFVTDEVTVERIEVVTGHSRKFHYVFGKDFRFEGVVTISPDASTFIRLHRCGNVQETETTVNLQFHDMVRDHQHSVVIPADDYAWVMAAATYISNDEVHVAVLGTNFCRDCVYKLSVYRVLLPGLGISEIASRSMQDDGFDVESQPLSFHINSISRYRCNDNVVSVAIAHGRVYITTKHYDDGDVAKLLYVYSYA